MFETKGLMTLLYGAIFFLSIFMPGALARFICCAVVVVLLIIKIRHAKETGLGVDSILYDIIMIAIIIIVNIGLMIMGVAIGSNAREESSKQETYEEINQLVSMYKLKNMDLFEDSKNHQAAIKKGFISYLKNDLGINENDLIINKNEITWKATEQAGAVFLIEKNDIKFDLVEFKEK